MSAEERATLSYLRLRALTLDMQADHFQRLGQYGKASQTRTQAASYRRNADRFERQAVA